MYVCTYVLGVTARESNQSARQCQQWEVASAGLHRVPARGLLPELRGELVTEYTIALVKACTSSRGLVTTFTKIRDGSAPAATGRDHSVRSFGSPPTPDWNC